MTTLGVILMLVGGIPALLLFLGVAPDFLADLPMPMWAWLATAAAGALLVILYRRPRN